MAMTLNSPAFKNEETIRGSDEGTHLRRDRTDGEIWEIIILQGLVLD